MPGSIERPISGPRKRLVVACDGTWLDSDNGLLNGQAQPPSNVSRIGWAIKDTSRDGIPQVVHYQAGVGSQGGKIGRAVGGATGLGLKANVREGYSFIAINWRPGDEIFLIGFSRGAFTARSIAGLIGELGLLTRKGLPFFGQIFEDVEARANENYVSQYPDLPFPNKPPFGKEYIDELVRGGFTRVNVPIRAVGVWDTVGSLGIPRIPILEALGLQSKQMRDYSFYDTRLNPRIENAFQALALDEHRSPFSPALWELRDNDVTNLKQVWFPGVHSNCGGGYDDADLANITLSWMMGRLEPWLDFHPDFLINCYNDNRAYYHKTGQRPRWWSFGEIYNSLIGLYGLTGSKIRTPGNYFRSDPMTGRATDKRLKKTCEYIHASVRCRIGLQGPGPKDVGLYEPRALQGWKYASEQSPNGGQMTVWTRPDDQDGQSRIPEAPLADTEISLLEQTPRCADFVRAPPPPNPHGGGGGGGGRKRRSGAFDNQGGPVQPPGGARRRDDGGGGGGGDRRRKRRSRQPRDN